MTIIEGVRAFIASCPFIGRFSGGVHIDFTDARGASCGIMPTGEVLLEEEFGGDKLIQYNFVLYGRGFTLTDRERVENSGFLEEFAEWLADRSDAGEFPALPPGRTPERMYCDNGALFDLSPDGASGLYQIQCHLIYERSKRW